MRAATELEALQQTLAAEHAAVHVLGVLGAQTSRSATPALASAVGAAYAAHRGRRDQLVSVVRAAGGTPVGAEPAYRLPEDLGTTGDPAAAVTREARRVEADCAATYAWLVGTTTEHRAWAVTALTDAAVRGLGFGATAETLPGVTSGSPTT
ncbi:DUF4439 domain-containing protein [Nocardioides pantholopis]|uniref:DUF4439 domain-containing protein n=1 Tax=Nocardioides pantholopis TaxID=2483798 RepID=UPI000F08B987|nr:DUF4439 domain-containing protein [Nocardioides pantholopis]